MLARKIKKKKKCYPAPPSTLHTHLTPHTPSLTLTGCTTHAPWEPVTMVTAGNSSARALATHHLPPSLPSLLTFSLLRSIFIFLFLLFRPSLSLFFSSCGLPSEAPPPPPPPPPPDSLRPAPSAPSRSLWGVLLWCRFQELFSPSVSLDSLVSFTEAPSVLSVQQSAHTRPTCLCASVCVFENCDCLVACEPARTPLCVFVHSSCRGPGSP